MRKIGICVLLVFVTLLSSQTFGYLENIIYCNIDNENIMIFLKSGKGTVKCQTYLNTLYQLAIKKYAEISAIRSYINQGDDVYYRKEILENKKSEFIQLVNYRTQIKTAMDKFELALFDKYYNAMLKPMRNYYSDLEVQYYILINQKSELKASDYSLRLAQYEQQMKNVNHILEAKKLDDIMEVLSSYLYLKNKIEGK